MCQMTPQHSSLPPPSLPSLFFVCLPDSPGVSSSLGPGSPAASLGESPPSGSCSQIRLSLEPWWPEEKGPV